MAENKLLGPGDLRAVTNEAEMAKAKLLLERKNRLKTEQDELREAFMSRDIHPQVMDRVNNAVRRAAEDGHTELMIITFPATYCNDNGRRINNLEADWPVSLEGFAKKAYEFYASQLRPLDYKIRAQILDYPGGMPGDVGIFLSW